MCVNKIFWGTCGLHLRARLPTCAPTYVRYVRAYLRAPPPTCARPNKWRTGYVQNTHVYFVLMCVCVRKRELAVLQVEWHCVYPWVRAQVRAQNVRTPFPDVAASEIRRNQGQRHDWMAFKVPEEFWMDVFWGQSGRARHASRAIARDACRVVSRGFPKGTET